MALPNLKSKIFDFSQPRPRFLNLPTPSKRFDLSTNLQQSLEYFEYQEPLRTPRHQKSKSLTQAVSKELIKLEQDLDYNELLIQKSSLSDQFQTYKIFFNALAQTLKFKDEKASRLVFRGIIGCERVFQKLSEIPKVQVKIVEKVVKPKVEAEDFGCQFETEKVDLKLNIEYDNIKGLAGVMDRIKISRISDQLEDLMENLNNMKTDIPSPSSSPELMPFEGFDHKRLINLKLTVMRENITKILKNPENISKKLAKEVGVQVNIEANSSLLSAFELMNKEKELDNFKLRSQNSINLNEKTRMEESLIKNSNIRNALEQRNAEYETELIKLRRDRTELQGKNEELHKNVEKLESALQKVMNDLKACKTNCKNIKNLLLKKQKYLQDTLDQLYNTQIMWKVAEKKLKSIEKAYLEKTGEQHKYKDINIFEITQKLGIKKIQLHSIDAEIQRNKESDLDQEYVPIGVDSDQDSENKIDLLRVNEETESVLSSRNDYSPYVRSRKISRNPSGIYEESDKMEEDEMGMMKVKKHAQGFAKKKGRKVTQKVEAKEFSSIREKIDKVENRTQESVNKKMVEIKNEDGVKSEIKISEKQKNYEKIEVNPGIREKKIYNEELEKTVNKEAEKTGYKEIEKKVNFEPRENVNEVTIVSDRIKDKKILNLSTNNSEIIQKHKNLKQSIKPNTENPIQPVKSTESQVKPTTKITETTLLSVPKAPPRANLSTNTTSLSNSNSNSIDLEPVKKNNLPNLPETSSEVSKASPVLQNYNENSKKIVNSQQIIKKSLQSTQITSSKFKVKISTSESTQSNAPDSLNFSTNPKTPVYVPGKFMVKKKGDEDLVEEKKFVNKKQQLHKGEQSFFDNETQSRSFETEKMNSVHYLNESSWISGLSIDQQKSFQIFQEKLKELKLFNLSNCSKSVQCLLLNDSSDFDNEKFLKSKYKHKDVLGKVFGNLEELDLLPTYMKIRLNKHLKGHNAQCAEICIHLKRVMDLKRKIRGVPYPIKIVKM